MTATKTLSSFPNHNKKKKKRKKETDGQFISLQQKFKGQSIYQDRLIKLGMLIWLSIGAFAQTWKLLHATMFLRFRVAHGEVVADFWPLTLLTWSQSQRKQKANSPPIDLV